MSILSTISEALHIYGKAINRNALTTVTFTFKSSPVEELPADSTWEVIVKLSGDRYTGDLSILDQGTEDTAAPKIFENVFTQEFKGEAHTEELALESAYAEIQARVACFLRSREEDTAFAQQAMMTITSNPQVELTDLWVGADPPSEGLAEGS
jgi:hypothetical protein